MCGHHYPRALKWFYDRRIDMPKRQQEQMEESRRRAAAAARLAAEARSIVYVVRREPDGLIKIGTTTRYGRRMASLRGAHGELRLFLAMPGGYKEEHAIHGKFAGLRVEGEWFRPERPLLRWILRMRQENSYPETRLPKAVPQKEIKALLSVAVASPTLVAV
jgi:hypothetical protein